MASCHLVIDPTARAAAASIVRVQMTEQGVGDDAERHTRFSALVEPEIDVLLRVSRTLADQPADAEDLVQETLLRAYRSIHTFDGRHPRAWLLTIMRNARTNAGRRRRPHLMDEPDAIERTGCLWPGVDAVGRGADATVVDGMFDAAVVAAVRALPLPARRVVHLVDVEGLSYADCARVLGIPVGTVMSRLHRARKRIRAELGSRGIVDAYGADRPARGEGR